MSEPRERTDWEFWSPVIFASFLLLLLLAYLARFPWGW
jgi:hypothetical protein